MTLEGETDMAIETKFIGKTYPSSTYVVGKEII